MSLTKVSHYMQTGTTVNVADFGWVVNDISAASANVTAINAALDYIASGKAFKLIIPAGVSYLNDTIQTDRAYTEIYIDGFGATLVWDNVAPASGKYFLRIKPTVPSNAERCSVVGLKLELNRDSGAVANSSMLEVNNFKNVLIDDVVVTQSDNMAITVRAADIAMESLVVTDCVVGGKPAISAHATDTVDGTGIWLPSGSKRILINNVSVYDTQDDGIWIGSEDRADCEDAQITNFYVKNAGSKGVGSSVPNTHIQGGYIDNTNGPGVHLLSFLASADNSYIKDTTIIRAGKKPTGASPVNKDGIFIHDCDNITIENCNIEDSQNESIRFYNTDNITISNTIIDGGGGDGAINRTSTGGAGTCSNFDIVDCTYRNGTKPFIFWTVDTANDVGVRIVSPTIYDCTASSLFLFRQLGGGTVTDIEIFNALLTNVDFSTTAVIDPLNNQSLDTLEINSVDKDGVVIDATGNITTVGSLYQGKSYIARRVIANDDILCELDGDKSWYVNLLNIDSDDPGSFWTGFYNAASNTVTEIASADVSTNIGFNPSYDAGTNKFVCKANSGMSSAFAAVAVCQLING